MSLDIDPFPGPDGSGDGFLVGKITTKNDRCWAEVHVLRKGEKELPAPEVTPQLSFEHGRWIFINFHYLSSAPPKSGEFVRRIEGGTEVMEG